MSAIELTETERELLVALNEIGSCNVNETAAELTWERGTTRNRLNALVLRGLAWKDNYQHPQYLYGITNEGEEAIK
jgi:predicted ArsR family transcriptional regulator